MDFGPSDTDPDTRRIHEDLLRNASVERRLALAFSLSRTAMGLCRADLERRYPGANPDEIGIQFVARVYGRQLADELRASLAQTGR